MIVWNDLSIISTRLHLVQGQSVSNILELNYCSFFLFFSLSSISFYLCLSDCVRFHSMISRGETVVILLLLFWSSFLKRERKRKSRKIGNWLFIHVLYLSVCYLSKEQEDVGGKQRKKERRREREREEEKKERKEEKLLPP